VNSKRELDLKGFINFEKKFMKSMSIVVIVISLLGIIINSFLGFSTALILAPLASLLIFIGIYFWTVKGENLTGLKITISILSFLFNNLFWYYNYGSHGPAPYLFVVTYSLLIFIWRDRQLYIVTAALLINICILFYLDYMNPNIILDYDNDQGRIVDSYTAAIMYGAFIFVLVKLAKDYLQREYLKAIESDQLKSSFLENMSHEIRTPLNAIVGFSGMIAESELHPAQKVDFKNIIDKNNELLLRLIDDILDMSKIESNTFTIKNKMCEINPFLEVIKNTFEQQIADSKKNLSFKMILPNESYSSEMDSTRVSQVLTNLIDNAIKFTESGLILVSVSYQKKYFKFIVQDTGIGIKEDEKDKIFDRFYKGKGNNNQLYRGTGIGLYLSSKIVELLGGRIWVDSKEGMGSTFSFTIPSVNTEVLIPETPKIESPRIIVEPAKEIDNRSKILIVEDDDSNLKLLETLLESWGYRYLSALTGEEALEIYNQHQDIKLVLLDLNLPGIHGYEVFKRLREQNPDLTILAQTANAMKEDEIKCTELGFNSFLRKPIESEFLRLHLRHKLRSK
jgi:signal transduction histidine kinase